MYGDSSAFLYTFTNKKNMMFQYIYNLNDYVLATGGEGGDALQLRRQLYAGVREDIRVVGQYEELPEFFESSTDIKAHTGVLQYRPGQYFFICSIMLFLYTCNS